MYKILAREDFSEVTFLLEVHYPMLAKAAKPGQFVIVMVHADGERIPLTIADFSSERGTITLVIQSVGKTTREMQQTCKVGDSLYAVVGPMGMPSHIGERTKVACVGGGLGVAPVFPQARAFKQRHPDIEEVIAIGPPVMMKFCAEATRPHDIKTMVSLNPIMVDGTGMCGGCRVSVGGEMKFCCVDGPDFDGHQVDFDELMSRLGRFKGEEREALERWTRNENCRLMAEEPHPSG